MLDERRDPQDRVRVGEGLNAGGDADRPPEMILTAYVPRRPWRQSHSRMRGSLRHPLAREPGAHDQGFEHGPGELRMDVATDCRLPRRS